MAPAAHSPFDAADRRLLRYAIGFFAIIVLVALLAAPPTASGPAQFPSSWDAGSGGAKAAYELLAESGHPVQRWMRPPQALPSPGAGAVLVLAEPVLAPTATADERNALERFVRSGGRVVAAGMSAAPLLPPGASPKMQLNPSWETYTAMEAGGLTAGAPRIRMGAPVLWRAEVLEARPVYGNAEGLAAVLAFPAERGQYVWWAAATPLTNAGLERESNLQFFLNAVGPARLIYWDEYYHGEREGDTIETTAALRYFVFPAGLLALALLWTFSRRRGPIAAAEAAHARESPLEFVAATGGLYERARARGLAVELIAQPLARWARRPNVAALLERTRAAVAGGGLNDKAALALGRALVEAEREARGGGAHETTNHDH